MTNEQLTRELSKNKTYIRELKTLISDLLHHTNVCQCKNCKYLRKKDMHCEHWNREVRDYGYCNYGVRK